MECVYAKDNKELRFFFEPQAFGTERTDNQEVIICKQCELVYYSYQSKIVPSDYKMTEQDKQDKKTGKYVFSYGSDEVSILDVQGVLSTQNRISFKILDNSCAVSKDEIMTAVNLE